MVREVLEASDVLKTLRSRSLMVVVWRVFRKEGEQQKVELSAKHWNELKLM